MKKLVLVLAIAASVVSDSLAEDKLTADMLFGGLSTAKKMNDCFYGNGNACVDLGNAYASNGEKEKALELYQRAYKIFGKECNNNVGSSCAWAGEFAKGFGKVYNSKQYEEKAREYFKMGKKLLKENCKDGVAEECSALSDFYDDGKPEMDIEKSSTKAKEYRKRACSLGYADACRK